ncbi:MAG TPA: crotonase/enoyl-CoA hydratase family protein [Mycobacteriales bacterium]|nr:crotonase/enoyl-CoA hydratase family protein [Mycobacteriales bacterium]
MTVVVERAGAVVTVILNRPERRNAVDEFTAAALVTAFADFEADSTASVAVLTGAGGSFCAGADLTAIAAGAGNRLSADGDGPMGPSRMLLSKPVIAAIEGYAVAGGLELALWCDLRVVAEDAVLGVFCRRWGVPLIDGGTVRLPRLVGVGRALDLIMTGRPVGAAEALAIGLADRVVAPGSARSAAEQLADDIAALPQACLRGDRMSVYAGLDLPAEQAMAAEFARGLTSLAVEGVPGATRFAEGEGRHGAGGANRDGAGGANRVGAGGAHGDGAGG